MNEIRHSIRPIPIHLIAEVDWLKLRKREETWDADREALEALGRSLAGTDPQHPEGQIHPVIVYPLPAPTLGGKRYGMVSGYRRLAAARLAGLDTLEAKVLELSPEDLDNPRIRYALHSISLRENIERKALKDPDLGEALRFNKVLWEEAYPDSGKGKPLKQERRSVDGFTRAKAQELQLSERQIRQSLLRAGLAEPVKTAMREGWISPKAADPLTRLNNQPALQEAVFEELRTRNTPPTARIVNEAVLAAEGLDPASLRLRQAEADVQTAIKSLRAVAEVLTPETKRRLPGEALSAFEQGLQALQQSLAAVTAALQLQVEGRLNAFALRLREALPQCRGLLWALSTGKPEEWATFHKALALGLQKDLQELQEAWQTIEPTILQQIRDEGDPPFYGH